MSIQHPAPTPLSFNASSIATLCTSIFKFNPRFTLSEKRAAARAILRHNVHIDASARAIPRGGLDRRYCGLHGKGNAQGVELEEITNVTKEVFRDLLDSVSYLSSFKT